MTENVPPGAATADQPGRPYYESLRSTLRATLAKKRQLDEQLAALEDSIYKLEGSYLEDTNGAGNIVRGFDNWVKGVVVGGDKRSADERKARVRVRDEDRIFSRSSMSWMRVSFSGWTSIGDSGRHVRDANSLQSQDSDVPTSATNTPSHAATPASSVPPQLASKDSNHATPSSSISKSTSKKKKVIVEKDEDEESKPSKRSKISYG